MNRERFMRELSWLLADVPEQERNEAILYYNEYFEDAGEDKESEVIAELKSPAEVAKTIKAGLSLPPVIPQPQKKPEKKSGWWLVLFIAIAILSIPLTIMVSYFILGVTISVFLAVIGLILTTLFSSVMLFIAGIILIGSGIGKAFEILMGGLSIVGAGVTVCGFGLMFFAVALWLIVYLFPWMCKGMNFLLRGGRKGGVDHA